VSHWESDQDYEEPNENVDYDLSLRKGADSMTVECSHFASEYAFVFELKDPVLLAALNAACEKAVEEHFRLELQDQAEQEANVREWLSNETTL
jgi:hypothetical protein